MAGYAFRLRSLSYRAQRRIAEAAYLEKLEDRIRSRHIVFAAVLQVMRPHPLSEDDAFALIRQTAMRHRTTIEQLSAEIIAVGGIPNRTSRTAMRAKGAYLINRD